MLTSAGTATRQCLCPAAHPHCPAVQDPVVGSCGHDFWSVSQHGHSAAPPRMARQTPARCLAPIPALPCCSPASQALANCRLPGACCAPASQALPAAPCCCRLACSCSRPPPACPAHAQGSPPACPACSELCFRRWTVDQRKRSCPSCRKPLASELPGICLRLARTIESLFPEARALNTGWHGGCRSAVHVVCKQEHWWMHRDAAEPATGWVAEQQGHLFLCPPADRFYTLPMERGASQPRVTRGTHPACLPLGLPRSA